MGISWQQSERKLGPQLRQGEEIERGPLRVTQSGPGVRIWEMREAKTSKQKTPMCSCYRCTEACLSHK